MPSQFMHAAHARQLSTPSLIEACDPEAAKWWRGYGELALRAEPGFFSRGTYVLRGMLDRWWRPRWRELAVREPTALWIWRDR